MACDSEKEVIVEGRKVGELVDEILRDFCGAWILPLDLLLSYFWEEFIWEFTQPSLKHGANDVDIVEVLAFEEINVKF